LNADLSVAPEIAQLAAPLAAAPSPSPARPGAAPRTEGRAAAGLAELGGAPQRWWDLVRFDPRGPLRIPLPGEAGAWLLVLPPDTVTDCDCRYATLLAGAAAEAAGPGPAPPAPRPLRPGRVLVHGGAAPHRVAGAGHGYSVTLHRAGLTPGE
jgi:hypothetical protein